MVEVPPEIQIRSTLKPGAVYYFEDSRLDSSIPHYFIVLNNTPLEDAILLLVVSSSKVDKVKKRNINNNPSETLVEISPSEYSEFSVESIIDCNSIFLKSTKELIQKVIDDKLRLKNPISSELLNKLQNAVIASPLVEKPIKRILEQ